MIALIVLAIVLVIVWNVWAPGGKFVRGFASLLDRPLIEKRSVWRLLIGKEQIAGHYGDREVVLVLRQKRDDRLGHLILAMRAHFFPGEAEAPGALRGLVTERAARDAWDALELHHELKLSFSEGCLKATWMPVGFFIFPGRFDEERWRNVLRAMHTLVIALERRAGQPVQ